MTYTPPAANSVNVVLGSGYTPPPANAVAVVMSDATTVKNRATFDMVYGLRLGASNTMPYSVLFPRSSFCDMQYSLKMMLASVQYYADSPLIKKSIDQNYSDSPRLLRAIEHKYSDMLLMQKSMDLPYTILKPLQMIAEARYGINGASLMAVMDQAYILSEFDLLKRVTDMPYLVQSDALVQMVSASAKIGGVDVGCDHINIECDRGSFAITGEVHLVDLAQYLAVKKGDPAEVVCNNETYKLIVESKKRSRPGGAVTKFIINLASAVLDLTAPWSRPLQQEFSPGNSDSIIDTLLGSHGPAQYLTTPFPVLVATLYANDEDARAVIRKLTQSVGAIMQSDPDGGVRIEAEYPEGWSSTAAVDYFLTDERNFVSQDESPSPGSGENKYLVGNSSSSTERTWPEQRSVSDTEIEVLGFQVPWGHKVVHGLTHSGGEWVTAPEYLGVVEEIFPVADDPAEVVEFKAGFGNASRPIYGGLQVEWLRESLGAITYAEDGSLEAELKSGATDGYSLCEIRYLTRYHLWKVRDAVAEDVQYILWVEE